MTEGNPNPAASGERRPLGHRLGDLGSQIGRKPPERHLVRRAVQIGVAALIFGFLVFTVVGQWDELKENTEGFEVLWILPSIPLVGLYYALGGLGWDLLARFLGHPLPAARAQMIWGQPLLARYVPGSVLFVMGRILLAEREGIARRTTIAMIVYEVGLAFLSAAIVGAYFLVDHPDLRDDSWRWAVLLVLPCALALFHPRVFEPLSRRGLALLGRDPLNEVLPFRGVVAMLVYYTLYWVILGAAAYFVARSVAYVDLGDLPVIASAQSLAFCAAVLSLVAPGGLGVRDGAFAWAVEVAVGSFVVAAAIAIATRLVMTGVEVLYVGVVTALGRRAGAVTEP